MGCDNSELSMRFDHEDDSPETTAAQQDSTTKHLISSPLDMLLNTVSAVDIRTIPTGGGHETEPRNGSHYGTKATRDNESSHQSGTKQHLNGEIMQDEILLATSAATCMSSLTPDQLNEILNPIVKRLEALDAAEVLNLTPSSEGASLGKGRTRVRPVHDLVTPAHRIDPTPSNPSGHFVRYLHFHEQQTRYSIGIFVFPPRGTIPLHDHPGMCVLSRVLYGDLTVKSFDWADDEEDEVKKGSFGALSASQSWILNKASNLLSGRQGPSAGELDDIMTNSAASTAMSFLEGSGLRSSSGGWKKAVKGRQKQISAPEVTVLYPKKGNVHEFVAGEHGAAVLDVLLPPYDFNHDRDCTFYKEKYQTKEGDVSWLLPVPQPESFHCISGRYAGLGDDNDDHEH